MKSISLLAVFLLLGLALWWGGARDGAVPVVATTPVAEQSGTGSEVLSEVVRPQRELVADEEAVVGPEQPADPTAVAKPAAPTPGPWWLRVRVVDERGMPVADAEVKLFEGSPSTGGAVYVGRKGTGPTILRTDANGRAEHRARRPVASVVASRQGVGDSNRFVLERGDGAPEELELVLEPPLLLHGVVRRVDGSPLPGALIATESFGICRPTRGRIARPEDVSSDDHGRFAVPVRVGGRYRLTAAAGDESTMAAIVSIEDRSPAEVVLLLPGAITVSGVVSDPTGTPVAGARVMAWRNVDFGEKLEIETDDGGGFRLPLPSYDAFRVVAVATGWASSEAVTVVPNAVRAHVRVGLRLQAFAYIRGRVVTADGSAVVGAAVHARPNDDRRVLGTSEPDPSVRFGLPPPDTSGDDGRFALSVHPGSLFTVDVVAAGFAPVRCRGVRPGDGEVLLVVGAGSCLVRGLVARADGKDVAGYEVHVVRHRGPLTFSSKVEPDMLEQVGVGDRFSLPLPVHDSEITVRVVPADPSLAPSTQGPFSTDAAEVELTFQLSPWATVPVEVVDANARPAAGARVVFDSLPGGTDAVGGWTDEHGRVSIERVVPGRSRMRVFPPGMDVVEREVVLVPGVNGSLLVPLPR